MKKCCKETYKKTLQEVLCLINEVSSITMTELIGTLVCTINMLNENKSEKIDTKNKKSLL